MISTELDWLPEVTADWEIQLAKAREMPPAEARIAFAALANHRLDFIKTLKLDRAFQRYLANNPDARSDLKLAILGSSTMAHLLPGIRVGALRRRLFLECYEAPYGMYLQEILDTTTGLHRFSPDAVLLAFDARHICQDGGLDAPIMADNIKRAWTAAKNSLSCTIIQQTILPVFLPYIGNNDHRLPESLITQIDQLNLALRPLADSVGVHLLAIDQFTRWQGGVDYWHEPGLWARAKQEVSPHASHLYGEQVGRILGALRGLTAKCLVLDLDNTLWGGVIGDDGLDGIVLGQGSAIGEAHIEVQRYAKDQLRRGIILAVCSKNDEQNALLPFTNHPEMILARDEISCFVANWSDKAHNIRKIAEALNIGLDSLVFVDDNPAERGLVRRELPMVQVPELPPDSADYVRCLTRAGYFEGLSVTNEDRERGAQYAANIKRDELRNTATDLVSYLSALEMELIWSPFDAVNLTRIVQLANKTNQFNLTTRRYLENEIRSLMTDQNTLTLQLRLKDTYGDNGIIGLIIAKVTDRVAEIETWLMSCRVLGRTVEAATLNLLVDRAKEFGAERLVGIYCPTAKNEMVRAHYPNLGFLPATIPPGGNSDTEAWSLDLAAYIRKQSPIQITRG